MRGGAGGSGGQHERGSRLRRAGFPARPGMRSRRQGDTPKPPAEGIPPPPKADRLSALPLLGPANRASNLSVDHQPTRK